MRVPFINKTSQAQQINTIREGFTVEPGASLTVDTDDLHDHEIDRLKKFFDFTISRERPEPARKVESRKAEEAK